MNKHLNELVFNLPVSSNKGKKPDKITILKMAVQHMKNLKGKWQVLWAHTHTHTHTHTTRATFVKMTVICALFVAANTSIMSDSFLCQNFITPIELQSLVLKESNEFLIVIRCDSSKILYASESRYDSIGFSSVIHHHFTKISTTTNKKTNASNFISIFIYYYLYDDRHRVNSSTRSSSRSSIHPTPRTSKTNSPTATPTTVSNNSTATSTVRSISDESFNSYNMCCCCCYVL